MFLLFFSFSFPLQENPIFERHVIFVKIILSFSLFEDGIVISRCDETKFGKRADKLGARRWHAFYN